MSYWRIFVLLGGILLEENHKVLAVLLQEERQTFLFAKG